MGNAPKTFFDWPCSIACYVTGLLRDLDNFMHDAVSYLWLFILLLFDYGAI